MRHKIGKLILVPTPIDENSPLEQKAFFLLKEASLELPENIFVIEELREGRRRWLKWGLPREAIPHFVLYNEHNRSEVADKLLTELKLGKTVFLMSDGGLPAFCDPGRELVDLCHQNKIKVTSTPFPHSVALGLSLSGFSCDKYYFAGLIAREAQERASDLDDLAKLPIAVVMMDVPYRLKKLLEEIKAHEKFKNHSLCLCLDLNMESEEVIRGTARTMLEEIKDFKREFILISIPNSTL